MITIPQQHYTNMLSIIKSLYTNFTLLLQSQSKQMLQNLFHQFIHLNTTLQESILTVNKQSQHHKIVLLQYESELNLLRHRCHTQHQTIKGNESQLTKLRQQLAKSQKQYQKIKEINKQLKQQLASKQNETKQVQEHFRTQIKAVKKEYKEENKDLKERVKQLEELLKTAILTNDSKDKEIQLDKELEDLKKYQLL